MIKASILGASGYAGGELIRFLLEHSYVEIAHLVGNSNAGQNIEELFPYLQGFISQKVEKLDLDQVIADSDLLFLAMPHGEGVIPGKIAAARGKKVIDLGADFRFRDAKVYEEWYKVPHADHQLTQNAVYGLPEIYREQIKNANIVGSAGCYPTGAILALYPLMKNKMVVPGTVIVDSKSGVSGAGKSANVANLYAELNDSINAYNVGKHRHTPEIEQALSDVSGEEMLINFTPHLTPMTRGILTTAYATLKQPITGEQLTEMYRQTYQNEFFIRIHDHGVWPKSKWVVGSNLCHLGVTYDPRTGRAVVSSAIDNLVKGAAGQAVQNMNIMFGLPENTGLLQVPMYP